LAIGLLTTAAAWSQDKPGSGSKGAPGSRKPAPAADGAETEDTSPYAGARGAAADEPAPADESPATSGDAKLDEPPPPGAASAGKDKMSPLNPEPEEFPKGAPPRAPGELSALLSDIATLRGRVAALTTSLFSSKLRIYVQTEGDDARIDHFNITLDEGVVFQAPARFVAEDARAVYEHAVAPGNHVIAIEIERHDARAQTYKTWQVSKFAIVVPDKQLLEVDLKLEDDSDIAEDFPDDQDGEYELGVRLRARVTE
jgi:hypothetical protein